jgi:hypothetical protein
MEVVLGGIITILVAVSIEMLRRPRLAIDLDRALDVTGDCYPLQRRDHVPSPGWSKLLRKGDVWEMVRLT